MIALVFLDLLKKVSAVGKNDPHPLVGNSFNVYLL